jgi:hypothetical protein
LTVTWEARAAVAAVPIETPGFWQQSLVLEVGSHTRYLRHCEAPHGMPDGMRPLRTMGKGQAAAVELVFVKGSRELAGAPPSHASDWSPFESEALARASSLTFGAGDSELGARLRAKLVSTYPGSAAAQRR